MITTMRKIKLFKYIGKFELLSLGEKRIVSCMLNEKSNNAIAIEFAIKQNTVSTFRKNIYKKLGVSTSIGLYKLALKEGIIK